MPALAFFSIPLPKTVSSLPLARSGSMAAILFCALAFLLGWTAPFSSYCFYIVYYSSMDSLWHSWDLTLLFSSQDTMGMAGNKSTLLGISAGGCGVPQQSSKENISSICGLCVATPRTPMNLSTLLSPRFNTQPIVSGCFPFPKLLSGLFGSSEQVTTEELFSSCSFHGATLDFTTGPVFLTCTTSGCLYFSFKHEHLL